MTAPKQQWDADLYDDKHAFVWRHGAALVDLLDPKPGERWLLVTSAHHMPRAIGTFRRTGFAVEAYPVDWRTRGPEDLSRPFRTLSDGLKRTDTAGHEWIGLLMYWLTGRSTELFPKP